MATVLVGLFDAVIFLDDVGLAGPWNPVIGIWGSFRMPLFFLTAGLFAGKAIGLSFADLVSQQIANLLWLCALWSKFRAIAFLVVPVMRSDSNLTSLEKFLVRPVWTNAST